MILSFNKSVQFCLAVCLSWSTVVSSLEAASGIEDSSSSSSSSLDDSMQTGGQHLLPTFSYFPFTSNPHHHHNHHQFLPGFENNNRRSNLLEPLFRRPFVKNGRNLFGHQAASAAAAPNGFNFNQKLRHQLDRSDETGFRGSHEELFNSPSVSIMRGGTFFEDADSNEELSFGKFDSSSFNGHGLPYFSEEIESPTHRKSIYQHFDDFRDFADITIPTSSKLSYAVVAHHDNHPHPHPVHQSWTDADASTSNGGGGGGGDQQSMASTAHEDRHVEPSSAAAEQPRGVPYSNILEYLRALDRAAEDGASGAESDFSTERPCQPSERCQSMVVNTSRRIVNDDETTKTNASEANVKRSKFKRKLESEKRKLLLAMSGAKKWSQKTRQTREKKKMKKITMVQPTTRDWSGNGSPEAAIAETELLRHDEKSIIVNTKAINNSNSNSSSNNNKNKMMGTTITGDASDKTMVIGEEEPPTASTSTSWGHNAANKDPEAGSRQLAIKQERQLNNSYVLEPLLAIS